MNNEIKEILYMLKDSQYIPSDDNRTYKLLDRDDTKKLLDYITNLQHQISLMEEDIRESKEINGELQQENERIEKEYKNKVDEIGKLISRIYKAIEYIKEHPTNTWYYLKKNRNKKINPNTDLILCQVELLNILQNGSDNHDPN